MELIKEKQLLFRSLAGLVGVATLVLVYLVFSGALMGQDQYPTRTLSVSAEGKVVAKPDVAFVSFSVISEGKDTKVISDENNTRMTKVTTFLKEQGIDEKDIKTTEYILSPVYSQRAMLSSVSFTPTIASYSLTQTVQVKIRDFSKVSGVVGQLVPMGVNRVQSVSFGIDDPEMYRAQARIEAIAKAKEKAEAMAEAADISLGDVVNVSEYAQGGSDYRVMSEKAMSSGYGVAVPAIAPSFEVGSQDVVIQAQVTYELK